MATGRILRDELVRSFILPSRLLWKAGEIQSPDILLQEGIGQATIWRGSGTILPPGSALLLDFGKEINGGVQIISGRFRDERVLRVRIRFGESVSEAMGEPDNDHAIHDTTIDLATMGATEFGNTGFRFVRIDSAEEEERIEIREVRAVSLMRDLPYHGKFECSDGYLNKIWETGAYTAHLCMQNYIWDGIKRDRLVWMGDMHPQVVVAATVFGHVKVVEESMDLVRDEAPLPHFMNGGFCSYSLWWIIAQDEWYKFHANYAYLDEQREYLTGLLHILFGMIKENGSENLPQHFLDWATYDDQIAQHVGIHALMVSALQAGARLCSILGEKQCKRECAAAIKRMRQYKIPPCASKQANALEVLAGLKNAAKANKAIFSSNPLSGLSTFYGYYILCARAMAGDYAGCLEVIQKYWGGMLDLGATTFWEHFDLGWMENAGRIDELPVPGRRDIHRECGSHCFKGLRHSFCHGWASGPTAWLSKYVLGVNIVEPGARVVVLKPHLEGLKWVRGRFPTPHGNIEIEHTLNNKGKVKTTYKAPKDVMVECD